MKSIIHHAKHIGLGYIA